MKHRFTPTVFRWTQHCVLRRLQGRYVPRHAAQAIGIFMVCATCQSFAQVVPGESDLDRLLEKLPNCSQQLRYMVSELKHMEARGDFEEEKLSECTDKEASPEVEGESAEMGGASD